MKILTLTHDVYQVWDDKEITCYFQGTKFECELYLENNRNLEEEVKEYLKNYDLEYFQVQDLEDFLVEFAQQQIDKYKKKIKETLNK